MNSRKEASLSEHLTKRWLGYAAAAGAAGIGLISAAPAAKADTIYTRTYSLVPVNGSLTLDFNHDGIPDLRLTNFASAWVGETWAPWKGWYRGVAGMSASRALMVGNGRGPSLLAPGAFIGSYQNGGFTGSGRMAALKGTFGSWTYDRWYSGGRWHFHHGKFLHPFAASYSAGDWTAGGTGYLGIVFSAADGFHYGWASIDIREYSSLLDFRYREIVTGYAYNTVPNAPITAGEGFHTPEPGTLGLLALGSLGIGLWRRKTVTGKK